jgi:hypothetical protein
MPNFARRRVLPVAIILLASGFGTLAGAGEQPAPDPAAPAAASGARAAGARYGQALGAVEICIGSKVTDKAKALGDDFRDGDLETYTQQAAKVYDTWLKVKDCRKDDPNQCKIIMDKSCEAAEAEIGPNGTVMPGLVEFLKR